jgi:hypothetical protein
MASSTLLGSLVGWAFDLAAPPQFHRVNHRSESPVFGVMSAVFVRKLHRPTNEGFSFSLEPLGCRDVSGSPIGVARSPSPLPPESLWPSEAAL